MSSAHSRHIGDPAQQGMVDLVEDMFNQWQVIEGLMPHLELWGAA